MGCHFLLQGIFRTQALSPVLAGSWFLYHWATREALCNFRKLQKKSLKSCSCLQFYKKACNLLIDIIFLHIFLKTTEWIVIIIFQSDLEKCFFERKCSYAKDFPTKCFHFQKWNDTEGNYIDSLNNSKQNIFITFWKSWIFDSTWNYFLNINNNIVCVCVCGSLCVY